jgi:hypothetical protein
MKPRHKPFRLIGNLPASQEKRYTFYALVGVLVFVLLYVLSFYVKR